MGQQYGQISIRERCEIARLQAEGYSVRTIATALDRSPSTVSRELKRNGTKTRGYDPEEAQARARARTWAGSRLDRDDALRETVLTLLKRHWSPEQVSGHLRQQAGKTVISYESIYRFIYRQIGREKNYAWRLYLPRRKSKREWRGRKGGSSATTIAQRRPLAERPTDVATRQTPGHWEADLMLFRRHSQAILALHERHTRLLIAVRLPGKGADHVATVMTQILSQFPPHMRQTVTFDNGTEFARHHRLHDLGVQTFFCDTYSPWQKGGVENAIGRLRRVLHRTTDLTTPDDHRFNLLVQMYNNTPRKRLGYRTPAAVLAQIIDNQVLHLKREFSFPLSRE